MKNITLIIIALFLVGCTAAPTDLPAETPVPEVTESVVTSAWTDEYEIWAWVDIPEPGPNDIVTVSGHLVKNDVYLGGVGMWMFWPAEDGSPVPHECVSYMMYQRGICQIIVKDYPPGQYVPVTVRVEYNDQVFTTETGFTPRGN